MLALTQLSYVAGSHELRSFASWMPFDLHYTTRGLASLMWLANKGTGTAKAMKDRMNVLGKDLESEPFESIHNITKLISHKADVIGDSSLIFATGPEIASCHR